MNDITMLGIEMNQFTIKAVISLNDVLQGMGQIQCSQNVGVSSDGYTFTEQEMALLGAFRASNTEERGRGIFIDTDASI